MKKTNIKYQVIRQIIALVKMSLPIALLWQTGAMLIFWVGKKLCKGTPVLIARNRTVFGKSQNEGSQATFERDMRGHKVFGFRNAAKGLAVAAAMPIISVPIQEVQLLDYAVAHETVNSGYGITASTDDTYMGLFDKDPYTSDQQRERDQYELNDTDWNEVVFEDDRLFRQESSDNTGYSSCKMALHTDWIKKKGYYVGAVVHMNLPEQGIEGPFRITSIKHILPQKKPEAEPEGDYTYKPVTALFIHQSDAVYNITFDDRETIGVTYQHPIFSVTAGDWRLAGELEVGEKVLTKSGEASVTSSEKKGGSELVYNLEVKDFHNFLVGESGIVVHNNYFKEVKAFLTQMSKADKQGILNDAWDLGFPGWFKRGRFIEELLGQTRFKDWFWTGGISSSFPGVDFARQVAGKYVAASVKSTKTTNVGSWISKNTAHLNKLRDGKIAGEFVQGANKVRADLVELHIFVPKANYSQAMESTWTNAIKALYPEIKVVISNVEKHVGL